MEILKRTISVLLALVMVVTMLPVQALAMETEFVTAPETTETEAVETVPEIVIEETAEVMTASGNKEQENNNTKARANYIFNGDTIYGEIGGNDKDYFEFFVGFKSEVVIDAFTEYLPYDVTFTFSMHLENEKGSVVASDTYPNSYPILVDNRLDYRISKTLDPGTYYLCLADTDEWSNDYAYEFSLSIKRKSCTTHSNVSSTVTKPTCVEDGFTTYTCKDCGESWKDDYVSATGKHSSSEKKITNPTCAEEGYTTYTCKDCGESWKDNYVPATGVHTYSGDNDVTCDICGAIRTLGIASGTCGEKVTWVLTDDYTLTISGSGKMEDYGGTMPPWDNYREQIKAVVIQKGITSIGNNAFACCYSLTSVTIPDGVTQIGAYAFQGCVKLESATLPMQISVINSATFAGCKALTSVTIPSKVTSIESSAFEGCAKLESVTIPNGVKKIGSGAFDGCESLSSLTIPYNVTSIEARTFRSCTNLESVTIPNSVTYIGEAAFSGCSKLKSITIPMCVNVIDYGAFQNCAELSTIIIPSTVTFINSNTFAECLQLKTVIFQGDAPEIFGTNNTFRNVVADVYYPADNESWNDDVKKSYGGTLNWIPIGDDCPHPHVAQLEAVSPTCYYTGLTEGKYCSACSKILVEQQVIPATGHNWQTEEIDPTCTEPGYIVLTCSNCGESYWEVNRVATGHIAGEWQMDEIRHWKNCTTCEEVLVLEDHNGVNCTICGYTVEETHGYDLGDVNHDGRVNAKDATLILQSSVGVLKDTAKFCETCAEVSGDGKLNAKDSTLILQFSVGLRDSFPAQEK